MTTLRTSTDRRCVQSGCMHVGGSGRKGLESDQMRKLIKSNGKCKETEHKELKRKNLKGGTDKKQCARMRLGQKDRYPRES